LTAVQRHKPAGAGRPEEDIPIHLRRVADEAGDLPVFTTASCASSMDLAWTLVRQGRLPDWASVLAGTQTSGRGQFRRTWHSPPGNLYGSLRLPRLEPPWSDLAALLLAESLRGILKDLGLTAAIKWPNDLLIGGKKVAGILVEAKSGTLIAGLGLNLVSAPPRHELRHPLAGSAGSLHEFGVRCAPAPIWIRFVRHTRSLVNDALRHGEARRFIDQLTPHLAHVGERILLDAHGMADQPAIFQGLDADGGIRVVTSEGERIFHSGSIYPLP
jgi:BirA family transcriptional regulator, biotin operon repressor / biotin---[acetyl-CoA-carboxylase] ligase